MIIRKNCFKLISSFLAATLMFISLPIKTYATGPTNLALNKNFIQYWVGADGTLGRDDAQQGIMKPETTTKYTVRESEEISVNFEGAGSRYSNAQSNNRLTDGVIVPRDYPNLEKDWVNSTWNNADTTRGRYLQCYRNDTRDMILDLEEMNNINKISLHMGDSSGYGIGLPRYVTYYLSETEDGPYYQAGTCFAYSEGASYANMAKSDTNKVTTQDNEPAMNHWYFDIDGINSNARYVRVAFDMNVWAFVDELEVYGSTTPDPSAPALSGDIWQPEAVENAYPTTGSHGRQNHDYLAYTGYYKSSSSEVKTTNKTESELFRTIAYVDAKGTPKDWLFDNITFLGHGVAKSGRYETYRNNYNSPTDYANKEDWQEWIDHIFDEKGPNGEPLNLDALDKAAGAVKTQLNDTANKVKVKISMVPPVHLQNDWGSINEGDPSLDFTLAGNSNDVEATVEARNIAMNWYIDEIITRFNTKNYQNIELEGFYYHDETMRLSADSAAAGTIKKTNFIIKENKLETYWIPFFQAEGYKKWAEFGFDYAIMQPNYLFDAGTSEKRIDDCATLSKKYGLGIEMEYNGTGEPALEKFKQYLLKGQTIGYQKEMSRMAWYMGTWDLPQLATENLKYRYLYDTIYNFVNGRPAVFKESILKEGMLTLNVLDDIAPDYEATIQTAKDNIDLLADGFFADKWNAIIAPTNPLIAFNNNAKGPYELIADLGTHHELTELSLSFFTWASAGIGGANEVTYSVSSDGVTWEKVGTVTTSVKTPISASYVNEIYTLAGISKVGRYVKAKFFRAINQSNSQPFGWIAMDEFIVKGEEASDPTVPEANIDLSKSILTNEMITLNYGEIVHENNAKIVKDKNNLYKGILANKMLSNGWDYSNPYSKYMVYNKGFVAGEMSIDADIGKKYDLSAISLNFIDFIDASHPESVNYFISNDGISWQEVGSVLSPQSSSFTASGKTCKNSAYALNMSGKSARYVRATFKHMADKNFMGCDEFTVIGTVANNPAPTGPTTGGSSSDNNYILTATDINNTGITIEIQKGVTNVTNPVLIANELPSWAITAQQLAAISEDYSIIKTFMINLFDSTTLIKQVQGGKIKVEIPFPGTIGQEYVVLRYNEDKTITELKATYLNGIIGFETDHFSTYAIAVKAEVQPELNPTTPPKTGDSTPIYSALVLVILAIGLFIYGKKICKQTI